MQQIRAGLAVFADPDLVLVIHGPVLPAEIGQQIHPGGDAVDAAKHQLLRGDYLAGQGQILYRLTEPGVGEDAVIGGEPGVDGVVCVSLRGQLARPAGQHQFHFNPSVSTVASGHNHSATPGGPRGILDGAASMP